jgi:hypothetical protein
LSAGELHGATVCCEELLIDMIGKTIDLGNAIAAFP